jgi:tetratricopeptide (TPR) repeat protein
MPESSNAPERDTVDSRGDDDDEFHDARFPAEEEAVSLSCSTSRSPVSNLASSQQLLKEAHEIKAEANQLFSASCYDQAISCYDRALASCPNYLDYDVAVLRSNISACYLKLNDWKAAVDAATASIERLDKIVPPSSQDKGSGESSQPKAAETDTKDSDAVVEITGDEEEAEKELQRLQELDKKRADVLRIRAKALMRRAKAKSQLGGWANLQGAVEDYQALAAMENLPSDDKRIVQRALRELPERLNQAKEKEMGEMMSKLKDVSISALVIEIAC